VFAGLAAVRLYTGSVCDAQHYYSCSIRLMALYRVAQKSKPLPNDKNIVLNRIKSLSLRLDLSAILKYESITIILFVCVRYSMCDLLSDLNNYA